MKDLLLLGVRNTWNESFLTSFLQRCKQFWYEAPPFLYLKSVEKNWVLVKKHCILKNLIYGEKWKLNLTWKLCTRAFTLLLWFFSFLSLVVLGALIHPRNLVATKLHLLKHVGLLKLSCFLPPSALKAYTKIEFSKKNDLILFFQSKNAWCMLWIWRVQFSSPLDYLETDTVQCRNPNSKASLENSQRY